MKTFSDYPAFFRMINLVAGFRRRAGLLVALAALSSPAHAQFTWDGGAGNADRIWSTNTNWNPNTAPGKTANQSITFSGATSVNNFADLTFNTGGNNYTEVWQVGSILFGSTASSHFIASNTSGNTPGTGGISISANGTAGDTNVAVRNASGVQQTITSGLTLTNAANNIFESTLTGGTLVIASSFLNNNGNLITTSAVNGAAVQLQSNITGTGGLTIDSVGTTTLRGTNTYSGITTLNSGRSLSINSNTALGTNTFVINGGTIDNGSSAAITLKNNNAQTWNSGFTYTGAAQSLNLGTGAVNLGAGTRTVTVSGQTLTVGGVISNGGLVKEGSSGSLTLTGANTFAGGLTLNNGTLNVGNAAALGTGLLTLAGGTLDNKSGAAITNSNNNAQNWTGNFTFAGTNNLNLGTGTVTLGSTTRTLTISAGELTVGGTLTNGGLIKQGSGALTLAGTNTFTNGTTLSAGTLNLNNNSALGTGTLTIGAAGATLGTTAGSVTASNAVALSNAVTANIAAANAMTLSGALSGSGLLTKSGEGALTLSGTNTNTGGITLNAGALNLNSTTALGATASTLTIAGGRLDNTSGGAITLANNNAQNWNADFTFTGSNSLGLGTGTATLNADRTLTVAANTLTVGAISGTNRNLTVAGPGNLTVTGIVGTGTGNVTQSGTGTLTLNGANTFSGGVTLNSGTVTLGNSAGLGTGTLRVNGGTLNAGAAGLTATNTVTFASGANLTFAGSNSMTLSGTLTLAGTNTINVGANNLTLSGAIAGGGLTKTGGGSLTLVGGSAKAYTGDTTVNAGTLVVTRTAGYGGAVVNSSSALVLGGGTLRVETNGAVSTQTFSGTTLNAGASQISRITTTTNNIVLGAITRNAGGTLNIISAAGTGNVTTTTTSTNGLLGGGQAFATITGNNWATRDAGGNIVAVTAYTADTYTTGINANVTASSTVTNAFVNSIRWDTNNDRTITIVGNLTVESGGILATSNVTNRNLTFTGGNLTTSANRELALISYASGGTITVASNITGATTGVTKSGSGAAILSGNNTYSGATYVNQGTLTLSGNNTLTGNTIVNGGTLILGNNTALGQAGTASQLILNGGTLNVNAARTLTSNNTQQWNGDFTFAGSNTLDMGTGAVTLGGNRTVTVTASTLTVGGAIGGGAVSLAKAGAGALVLGGANTYSGGTTVSGGTMTVTGTLASTGSVSVSVGTLVLNNAQTIGSLSGNGTVNFANNFTVNNTDSSRFTGTLGGAGALIKDNTGTLTLNGTNTYSGGTTIANGTVAITTLTNSGSSSNLGTGNLILGSGANSGTLLYTGAAATSNRTVTLAGTTGGGTIIADGTGALTLSGTVTGNVAGTKTLTLSGSNLGANTLGGIVSDGSGVTALAKAGVGNWTLTAANTYTGGTTISDGNLTVASGGALGGGNLTLTGGTLNLNNATQNITNLSGSAGTINLAGTNTLTVAQAVANTYSGGFSGAGNIVKAGSSTLTLAGTSSNSGQVTVSGGTLVVTGNTSLGAVGTGNVSVVNGSTLVLGSTFDSNHGRLTLGNGTTTGTVLGNSGSFTRYTGDIVLGNNATINGVGTTGTSHLALGAQPPALSRSGFDITPQHFTTLDLGSNNLTTTGTGYIFLNSMVTGTGNLVVAMNATTDRTVLTSRMNTFTGNVQVDSGTFRIAPNNGNSSPFDPATPNYHLVTGNVTIGNASGGTSGGNARDSYVYDAIFDQTSTTGHRESVYFNSAITLRQDGRWDLGVDQTIGSLTMNGGRIDLGSNPYGNLFLNGDVTVNATANNTAYITGGQEATTGLSLTRSQTVGTGVANAIRTFTVADSSGVIDDLRIEASVLNGGLIKAGVGTMTLTGNNTYELTTTVNNGILNIQHNFALGQGGSDPNATTVNTGGQLQLDSGANGNLTIASEKLNLNGTGFGYVAYNNTATLGGTLLNNAGSHTWNGQVVSTDGSINTGSSGRTLTIGGTLTTGGTVGTTIFNAGNLTITGDIGGAAGFAKYGSGTTVIAGAGSNTYSGNTTVEGGVLHIQKATALGAGTGTAADGTTVKSGASLYVSGGFTQLSNEALFIAGTGTGGASQGAIHNDSGTNILNGVTTLQAASSITAAAGSSLQIRGGITGTQNLTIGNASQTGTVIMSPTSGSVTGTVGEVDINGGTFQVGGGGTSTTLNTGELESAAGTTLILASGGTVNSVYNNGAVSNFNGVIGSGSVGTFAVTGNNGSALAFNTSFSAPNATFTFGGTSIGDNTAPLRLELGSLSSNIDIAFGTIRITGDTILDFNNSVGTSLTSATLIIDAGVKITVEGWVSTANNAANSTIWYATNTTGGVQGWNAAPTNTVNQNLSLAGGTQFGNAPLSQVVFTNYAGLTTTWVSGTPYGWFDKEIRPTPEPATYGAIFISGCLGLLGYRRYRGRKSAAAAAPRA